MPTVWVCVGRDEKAMSGRVGTLGFNSAAHLSQGRTKRTSKAGAEAQTNINEIVNVETRTETTIHFTPAKSFLTKRQRNAEQAKQLLPLTAVLKASLVAFQESEVAKGKLTEGFIARANVAGVPLGERTGEDLSIGRAISATVANVDKYSSLLGPNVLAVKQELAVQQADVGNYDEFMHDLNDYAGSKYLALDDGSPIHLITATERCPRISGKISFFESSILLCDHISFLQFNWALTT